MIPHPILMDSYWHDRNRLVLEATTRQQHLDRLDAKPAAETENKSHLATRILAFLVMALGRSDSLTAEAAV